MGRSASIDELFTAFARSLPDPLNEHAKGLACTLGLAPTADVPWSEVFGHEVTLGAPAMVAEAMSGIMDAATRDAQLAHLLAVIEAFGTDRIEDEQVEATPALRGVLAAARRARDEALERIVPGAARTELSYEHAERVTLAAITAERRCLRLDQRVGFEAYLAISHDKQRLGLPASLALATSAGWDVWALHTLGLVLDGVWLGLQLHDDVVDWIEDHARGGAWATTLAGAGAGHEGSPPSPEVRRAVYDSGVLARMLHTSARKFRSARRRAEVLGARRLAAWAREREITVGDLAQSEARSPGFTNRAHALSSWAKTVLV